ncbi:MAG: Tfp pilus assembly protein FimT/FimU, partial [Alphaproteobacteria bacterium]
MFAINNLFKKKVCVDLLKNKDFSASSESGGAAQKSGRTPAQSGRTMTEMLGVLAVIGVLSIGGVAGYSYAMDKYRANVTINDINLRA